MSITSLIGFDDLILRKSGAFDKFAHKAISWMFAINILIFFGGVLYFFSVSVTDKNLLYFIAILLSLVFFCFTRMIIATHDHSLSYYAYNRSLELFQSNISVHLRLFVVLIFSLLASTGYLLWITEPLVLDVIDLLHTGNHDYQFAMQKYFLIQGDNYDQLNNISDRLMLLRVVLGPWRYLIAIPYILVSFILLLPFVLKLYLPEISNGKYELLETELETKLVLSEYEYTWDVVNSIRNSKYGLPSYRYENYWDPPFNTLERKPPLDKLYPNTDRQA